MDSVFDRGAERLVEDLGRRARANSAQEPPPSRNTREMPSEVAPEMSRVRVLVL